MKVEVGVEVIHSSTIKPSSPTPPHLQTYQLSFLDQIAPPVFMPLVLFYPDNHKLTNLLISNHLKESLSEALTRFYPLAGRVRENLNIDCNDQGIPYVETRVNCHLSEFIKDPVPCELNKLLPCELDDVQDLLLSIQVNFFNCGGLAVAVAISHKIADALSLFTFVTGWAATARGDADVPFPIFGSSALFPPRDTHGYESRMGITRDNIVTKRFVFTASKIVSLRDNYTDKINSDCPKSPTRIEALTAFLWSRIVISIKSHSDKNKIYSLTHAVNLRPRFDPPLSVHFFGNISRIAIAAPPLEDDDEDSYRIVNCIKDSVRNINKGYVGKLQEGQKHLDFIKDRAKKVKNGEVVSISFTSLCRFPLYEADFGWGKPIWVGSASLTFRNLVVFMDTQSGDGIEAWINLKEEDMAKVEVDKELLAFVLPSKGA